MVMVNNSSNQTIAAVATGGVLAAIGIVRVSGPETLQVIDAVFKPMSGKPMSSYENRKLIYGKLLDAQGDVIDWCLCTISRGPHSYTGEDTAELQCHGSPVVLQQALESLFSVGARQALAGEFTRRAFLNGCMDLTQAEAVIDLIDAQTPQMAKNAAGQLSGAVSRRIDEVYESLTDICSHYHAVLDYPDEEIPPFTLQEYEKTLEKGCGNLQALLDTFSRGKTMEKGIPTVILGKPNAGKSSLLNALLGYERAIVTNVPGTTRDTLSETCMLGKTALRLTDTAGVHETNDEVEQLGVDRSRKAAQNADLALAVFDTSVPWAKEDDEIVALAKTVGVRIAILNKQDLVSSWDETSLPKEFDAVCILSAKENIGLNLLEEAVEKAFPMPQTPAGEILTNARQADAVGRALDYLKAAKDAIKQGMPPDVVLTECEGTLEALGELTGSHVREDVTNKIFSRFCVGK